MKLSCNNRSSMDQGGWRSTW